jgi:hypothetical protein
MATCESRTSTVRISKKKTITETCDVDKTMADDLSKHIESRIKNQEESRIKKVLFDPM